MHRLELPLQAVERFAPRSPDIEVREKDGVGDKSTPGKKDQLTARTVGRPGPTPSVEKPAKPVCAPLLS